MSHPRFEQVLRTRTAVPADTLANKLVPLSVAVQRHVRPGMALHFASTTARPVAAAYEVIRQFHGQDSGFTLHVLGCSGPWLLPVAAGIVRRIVTSFAGDTYPTPGPNPLYQNLFKSGQLDFELWSILSFTLRLKAAAMGVPYLPTRSVVGSSMADENGHALTIEESAEGPIALVHALAPDVSFVHAWAADRSGNAVLPPPYGENVYGALAAKRGVILTADRIVSTEVIRDYSHTAKLPGTHVVAVCEAPFGAHPTGMNTHACAHPGWTAYADDYPFLEAMRSAARKPETMEAFLREWVLDTHDWQDVMDRLGEERLARLERLARDDGWQVELEEVAESLDADAAPNGIERMIVAAAQYIQERVHACGYETLLAGVGASNLAAWLAQAQLHHGGTETQLMAEVGFFGYHPRPADPFIFNLRNVPTCSLLADVETIMGMFLSGPQARTLGVLGAGQVDAQGNINSTRIGTDTLLVGSGGANDVCSGAREVLVCALQSPERFVPRVNYVTAPGHRVRTVVTPYAILEKLDGRETLTLTAVYADGNVETAVREARARCGWDLAVVDCPETIPPPAWELVHLLRIFDPRRQFLGKST